MRPLVVEVVLFETVSLLVEVDVLFGIKVAFW